MRLILAPAVAALAFAAPALANVEVVEIRVSHADIDVMTAEGRAAFEQRVKLLAREACEIRDPLGRAPAKTDWNCVNESKRAALAKLESPRVTQTAVGAN